MIFLIFLSKPGAIWREPQGNHQNSLSLSPSCLFYLLDMYQTWTKPFWFLQRSDATSRGTSYWTSRRFTILLCPVVQNFSAAHRSRVIGLPNHFPYEYWWSVTLCAANTSLGPQPPQNSRSQKGTDEKEIPKVPSGVEDPITFGRGKGPVDVFSPLKNVNHALKGNWWVGDLCIFLCKNCMCNLVLVYIARCLLWSICKIIYIHGVYIYIYIHIYILFPCRNSNAIASPFAQKCLVS